MSRLYGDKEDEVINLEEVDMLLDMDELSDTELGAAISACHIASVDECYTRGVGRCPEDDQAITIPELVQKGLKDDQYKAQMKVVKEEFLDNAEECSMILQPFFKIKLNVSVVCQNDLEFLVYHLSCGKI